MKLIIEIPDKVYNEYREGVMSMENNCIIGNAVFDGIPYEERPQGEFTDLEQKVIADAINYLLGAELLEENGYTEEVIDALKSALQKLDAEEDHL